MKYRILKHGTTDIGIVESNPVIFRNDLWICKSIRGTCSGDALQGQNGFLFRNMETGEETPLLPCTGFGHCAYSTGTHIIVTYSYNHKIWQTDSNDLVHWSESQVILEGQGWSCYNTSICKQDDRYVMVFELGEPANLVGEPYTMFFAESKDLKTWSMIPISRPVKKPWFFPPSMTQLSG